MKSNNPFKRVHLLLTVAPDRPHGSMRQYAELTEQALLAAGIPVSIHHLAPRQRRFAWLPGKLDTIYRYLVIFFNTRKAAWGATQEDLYHVLDGGHGYVLLGLPRRVKKVCTVHDVMPLLRNRGLMPGSVASRFRNPALQLSLMGLKRADRIVSVSENTGSDLIRLGADKNRISVVYSPLPDRFRTIAAKRTSVSWSERTKGTGSYVFHISNNNFYKNRGMVVTVFAKLQAIHNLRLKLAGNPPDKALQEIIDESGVADKIDFAVFPSDEELQKLYSHAAVFLFPSTYEGFGWPPLEAMALGCPVVAGDAPAVNEICAGAALFAPPDDAESLTAACREILDHQEKAERLIIQGQAHAATFTVTRFAEQLVDAYRKIT